MRFLWRKRNKTNVLNLSTTRWRFFNTKYISNPVKVLKRLKKRVLDGKSFGLKMMQFCNFLFSFVLIALFRGALA